MYLAPGFIDIHIHGAGGYDTMDDNNEAINEISKKIIGSGVTSFLPTTMTMSSDDIERALINVRETYENKTDGARVVGINVEGPFISKKKKGAQKEKYIVNPQNNLLKDYLDIIKIITIAPELDGAEEFVRSMKDKGIVVSAGHTSANYDQIKESMDWGVSHITHLFNAMTGLHHRHPGVVGGALESNINCELIADFIHLHPAIFNILFKTKNIGNLVLVTDQMRAGSMGEGTFELGEQEVEVKKGEARLANGQLAGSVLTLDKAVRNINFLGKLTIPQIISMVTKNPAEIIGMDDQIGQIKVGYKADLLLLDNNLNVKQVFKEGKRVREV